jgi:tyrosinase
MPGITKPYWKGKHTYSSSLTMSRTDTYSTRTTLGYRYASETFPTQLPVAQLSRKNIYRVQATSNDLLGSTPPVGSFPVSGPHQTSDQTFYVTGALNVGLVNRSISVQLPVAAEYSRALVEIAAGRAASVPGSTRTYRSAFAVFDGIEMSESGKNGGYFYQIYLNIISGKGIPLRPTNIYIGTVGPFEINAASHHAGGRIQLRYPIKDALSGASMSDIGMMSVSFVRVNGDRSPAGGVIGISEVRVEISTTA